jgi:uncharacterized NAD(P)/FAD-binding protein YdhS
LQAFRPVSSKLPEIFDIAVVGGGFSALSTLAHIVRFARSPLSVRVIGGDGFRTFGPAYSTPRPEHLLNVRTIQMSLYEGERAGFLDWAQTGDPDGYLPRRAFAAYLKDSVAAILQEAEAKSIGIDIVGGDVRDIDGAEPFALAHGGEVTRARRVVLATGNNFSAAQDGNRYIENRYIENPWHFDYARLPGADETIAIVGSGLSAVDVIVSLHHAGWKGKTVCISGNGYLPRKHPARFEKEKIPPLDPRDFQGKGLSFLMREIRHRVRTLSGGQKDWAYVFYALRPVVPEIWESLSPRNKDRALRRYLWLWNIHRHRYAAELDDGIIQPALARGDLEMRRGKVTGAREDETGVTLDIRTVSGARGQERFALAFKCVGPSYRAETNPLIRALLEKNIVRPHATGYGLAAGDDLAVAEGIYAVGPLLFGAYLETTAVPEIRAQSAKVAGILTKPRK